MSYYLFFSAGIFIVSTVLTYLSTPFIIKYAHKKGYICTPRDREIDIPHKIRKRSHDYQIPVIGGWVIFIPFVFTMLSSIFFLDRLFPDENYKFRFYLLLISSILVFIIGYFDDIKKLSYITRFIIEIVIILSVLLLTLKNTYMILPSLPPWQIGYFEIFLLLIWSLGLCNSINLIDGLDGSASGIIVIATVFLSLITATEAFLVTMVLMSVMAACIAFLSYNFHPAKLFLGSSGTLFLGYVLSILTVWQPNHYTPNYYLPYAVLIFAVPITDMAVVFMIRILKGRNPFVADSWHIHDRVLLTGLSRKQSVVVIWSLSFLCGLISYLSYILVFRYLIALIIVFLLLLTFYIVIIKLEKSDNLHSSELEDASKIKN